MMRGESVSSYDVIIAADVFIYVGKLDEIIREIKRLLRPGGVFAFSLEALVASSDEESAQGRERDYRLQPTCRYSHSTGYMARLASANGFVPEKLVGARIRMEKGQPVHGYLVLWRT